MLSWSNVKVWEGGGQWLEVSVDPEIGGKQALQLPFIFRSLLLTLIADFLDSYNRLPALPLLQQVTAD
jgi:hypothetical protein